MPHRRSKSTKRRIRNEVGDEERLELLARVRYAGSPYHKRRPGDFEVDPPGLPRPDKTLCDEAGIFQRSVAESALREGVARGLISPAAPNSRFPKNVWSVANGEIALEAQLENPVAGTYHGYPLLQDDAFREVVLDAWLSSRRVPEDPDDRE